MDRVARFHVEEIPLQRRKTNSVIVGSDELEQTIQEMLENEDTDCVLVAKAQEEVCQPEPPVLDPVIPENEIPF